MMNFENAANESCLCDQLKSRDQSLLLSTLTDCCPLTALESAENVFKVNCKSTSSYCSSVYSTTKKYITPIQVVAPFLKTSSSSSLSEDNSFLNDDQANLVSVKRKSSILKKLTNILSGVMIHFIQFLD